MGCQHIFSRQSVWVVSIYSVGSLYGLSACYCMHFNGQPMVNQCWSSVISVCNAVCLRYVNGQIPRNGLTWGLARNSGGHIVT